MAAMERMEVSQTSDCEWRFEIHLWDAFAVFALGDGQH